MKNFVLQHKILLVIISFLFIYIFITDIYKWELYENWAKSLDTHQFWRRIHIQVLTDPFYGVSYNTQKITSDNKIIIWFYTKPIFLVWSKQSDIIDLWLDYEWTYKLYYMGKNWEPTYLRDIKYSKEMDNTCSILNN